MTIDWVHFKPVASIAGGILIGLGAVGLLQFAGRIAGISGILGGAMRLRSGDTHWRLAFLAGLLLAPWMVHLIGGTTPSSGDASLPVIVLAGFLVGFGTRWSNGCTSGHGVCGLSNLSPRGLAAVLVFMATGIVTVFLIRHGGQL